MSFRRKFSITTIRFFSLAQKTNNKQMKLAGWTFYGHRMFKSYHKVWHWLKNWCIHERPWGGLKRLLTGTIATSFHPVLLTISSTWAVNWESLFTQLNLRSCCIFKLRLDQSNWQKCLNSQKKIVDLVFYHTRKTSTTKARLSMNLLS